LVGKTSRGAGRAGEELLAEQRDVLRVERDLLREPLFRELGGDGRGPVCWQVVGRALQVEAVVGQREGLAATQAGRAQEQQHPSSVERRLLGEQLELLDGEGAPGARVDGDRFDRQDRLVEVGFGGVAEDRFQRLQLVPGGGRRHGGARRAGALERLAAQQPQRRAGVVALEPGFAGALPVLEPARAELAAAAADLLAREEGFGGFGERRVGRCGGGRQPEPAQLFQLEHAGVRGVRGRQAGLDVRAAGEGEADPVAGAVPVDAGEQLFRDRG
jgi:hypothetical protein